jgi:hypothetical protein
MVVPRSANQSGHKRTVKYIGAFEGRLPFGPLRCGRTVTAERRESGKPRVVGTQAA